MTFLIHNKLLCLAKERKRLEKKMRGKSGFFISTSIYRWKENERKKIEKKISLACLCGKVKGKKKIIMSNDNFTLMLL